MSELNTVFQKIKEAKKKRKGLMDTWKDMLANSKTYQETVDELTKLVEKKRQLESQIKQEFLKEMEELERIKMDIKDNMTVMSDMALTSLMKGETVQLVDENEVKYEPQFSVKFKKSE